MRVLPPDGLRTKLEQRAELLEATRLRYRALAGALRGFFWKEKLRRNAELLREVARAQPEVELMLSSALRRADAEGWDPRDPLTRCLHEVSELREALVELSARRLQVEDAALPLAELLVRLEALQAGPRRILPGQRWATALEVLPASLPEIQRAKAQGDLLERLFKRPMDMKGPLPLSAAEAALLRDVLRDSDEALQALWRRTHQCDPSGGLLRFLQRRARRAPIRPARTGPEELLRTAFWLDVARARLKEMAEVRLTPVQVAEPELLDVVAWLIQREHDPDARLAPTAALPADRVAVLELARELWSGRRQEVGTLSPLFRAGMPGVVSPRAPPLAWERLVERARSVDAAQPGEDVERLRDVLRLFVRIRERADQQVEDRSPEPRTLEEWIQRARVASGFQ